MKKVMLVEDEELIREGLKKILEEIIGGYQVCAAAGEGGEALQLLGSADPDLVITDIRMIGMDGLELIREIRRLKYEIPVIVVSGYAEFDYAQRALKYNVHDYLLKPIDPAELAGVLSRLPAATADRESAAGNYLIRRVREIVDTDPAADLSLRELASLLSINPQYLSRMFKEQTGTNISEYITGIRMKKAVHLLKSTNLKIYEIASLCGYPGVKYFNNLFKKVTGMTPTQVRDKG